jgi:hypothetical protein
VLLFAGIAAPNHRIELDPLKRYHFGLTLPASISSRLIVLEI